MPNNRTRQAIFGLSVLLLVGPMVGAADARQKKPAQPTPNCRCGCFQDGYVGEGPRPKITIEFYNKGGTCSSNNGGGCRLQQPDGTYKPGTVQGCRSISNADTAIQGGQSNGLHLFGE